MGGGERVQMTAGRLRAWRRCRPLAKSGGTQRPLESPSMSGVRVGTWVAATHDDLQSAEVEIPALAVVASLVVVRETVVAQGHSGAAIVWLERHHHAGTARRNRSVLVPAQLNTTRRGGSISMNSPDASTPLPIATR